MKDPKKVIENLIGAVTVGSLLKGYRLHHELTIEAMAKKIKVTKSELQKIESGKHRLTLKEVVAITKKIDAPKNVYARVWCEEEARAAGLNFDDLLIVI